MRTSLGHWSVGYPYSPWCHCATSPACPRWRCWAWPCVVGAGGGGVRALRAAGPWLAATNRNAVLVVALALAVPVGAAVLSAVGDNLFSTRNLAASWPGLGLAVALLLVSSGPRLRYATAGLAVLALAIGAVKMLDEDNGAPAV